MAVNLLKYTPKQWLYEYYLTYYLCYPADVLVWASYSLGLPTINLANIDESVKCVTFSNLWNYLELTLISNCWISSRSLKLNVQDVGIQLYVSVYVTSHYALFFINLYLQDGVISLSNTYILTNGIHACTHAPLN